MCDRTSTCVQGAVPGQRGEGTVADMAGADAAARRSLERQLEAALSLAEDAAKRELVVESMPQIVWIARPDGWHTYFNRKWCEFTGLTGQQSLGHGWNPPFHPDDRARAAKLWQQATSTGEPYEIEYRLRRADGIYRWMLGRASPLRDAAGNVVKWFGTCTDIEELKQAQLWIAEQARLLDLVQDAIFVADLDHRVVYWNQGAERLYGWPEQSATGRVLHELIYPDVDEISTALEIVHEQGAWTGDLHCASQSGRARLVDARWTLLRNVDGSPRGVLAVNTDVTERRETEAKLIQMLALEATRDPLTGLPNRALLTDRLDEAVAAAQRDGTPLAVLFVDLDGFKEINDGSGHLVGDKVLEAVGARIQSALRDRDTVARFGGDEFVVLLPDTDAAAAERIGRRMLTAIRRPLLLESGRLHISASIGVAASPQVAPEALLRSADAAVYQAKAYGRNQVRCFLGDMFAHDEGRLHGGARTQPLLQRPSGTRPL